MKKFRNLLFVVLLLFLFVEVLIVFPKSLDDKSDDAKAEFLRARNEQSGDQTMQKMEGVHLVESKGGHRVWELFSKAAEGSQAGGNWNLADVKLLFYNENVLNFTVTGKAGYIDANTRDIRIKGQVQMLSSNGYVFATEQIEYIAKLSQLVSNKQVIMTSNSEQGLADFRVSASQMITHVNKNKMALIGNVKGFRKISKTAQLEVESGAAEFSSVARIAKFSDGVKVISGMATMNGPEAEFQYGAKSEQLESVLMRGGVSMSDGQKSASSENVRIDLGMNKFIFRGSPKLVQNEDELVGEEIIFLDGGKKVRVERVRARVDNLEEKR
jgi:LPS export ABC transporter protein LptC